MIFYRKIGPCLVLLHLLAVSLVALEWKATTVAVTTAPFQTEQDVIFEFANHRSRPVTIREIETSCSCVSASSDLKNYAPGAGGKITARFTVGDRGGLYERTITVLTDEPGDPVHLTLKIEVPDVASATPRSVEWRLNEDPVEKFVELRAAPGLEIIFSTALSTSETFTARLESMEAGLYYRLYIKPVKTNQPASAAIRISGREKSQHEVVISAYASVQTAQR
jgi:Protein of unknown function (DUF1573)